MVQMAPTTCDEDLCKMVSTTKERFETLKIMRDAGIPAIVWLSPVLPFINDTKANLLTGVNKMLCCSFGPTLRHGNREYFYRQLDAHSPSLKDQYLRRYGNSYV